jgi:uncharacterized repeat protein (TIGR01451 family)
VALHKIGAGLLAAALLGFTAARPAVAQTARVLVTAPIDVAQTVTLRGNVRPEATAANDRERVADSTPLPHLQLLLNRPAEREQALRQYIDSLHDRGSAQYHRWLTPAQLGQRFGPTAADISAVTGWLTREGFTVNAVSPSGMTVDFSGTAGQVATAFHAEIHAYSVGGRSHIANATNPQVPAALAPVIHGVVSLNDFYPRALLVPRVQYTTSGSLTLLSPADLATIYALNQPFAAGLTGSGQTIALIEDTDIYMAADWSTFRGTFGLSGYSTGSLVQVHPAPASGNNNCADPGVLNNGADGEAILDAEWSSAAAPGAAIELVSCADSGTFGGLIALQNLVNATITPPPIISISYGDCEAGEGATANAAYATAYQQSVAEGVSVFVAAGDAGAAACDPMLTNATHGIGVNGLASTADNVAVGGTDFGDTYANSVSTYWSSSNTPTYESALSYVPEIPWNDSCAGVLLASFEGYGVGYGSSGYCNSGGTATSHLTTAAGSGGASGCASGRPSKSGVVGGSCAGTAKPSWQTGVTGIVADSVRDLPDIALFASNGLWGHYYVFCWSNPAQSSAGAAPCTGAPSGWSGGGGTSFASPILAGIQALINQNAGARQGNPNYLYYQLAAIQVASGMNCNATSGNAVAAGCVFHDVTQGDITVDCTGKNNCYLPSGTYGELSTSNTTAAPAFAAATGWDFATGLGSVNAANLIAAWESANLMLTGSGGSGSGGLLSYSLKVMDSGPQTASGVIVTSALPSGMSLLSTSSSSGCSQSGQVVTCTVGSLAQGGAASLTVVIQPGSSAASQLSFAASSSSGDFDPAGETLTFALNLSPNQIDSDGPMPLWSIAALGLLLAGIGTRTRRA